MRIPPHIGKTHICGYLRYNIMYTCDGTEQVAPDMLSKKIHGLGAKEMGSEMPTPARLKILSATRTACRLDMFIMHLPSKSDSSKNTTDIGRIGSGWSRTPSIKQNERSIPHITTWGSNFCWQSAPVRLLPSRRHHQLLLFNLFVSPFSPYQLVYHFSVSTLLYHHFSAFIRGSVAWQAQHLVTGEPCLNQSEPCLNISEPCLKPFLNRV